MLARVFSCTVIGLEGIIIEVEVDTTSGLGGVEIVGLPDKPCRKAANVCMQTQGGYGFTVEYDVERKSLETKLYQVAPISTNLILSYIGQHVLEMLRSF